MIDKPHQAATDTAQGREVQQLRAEADALRVQVSDLSEELAVEQRRGHDSSFENLLAANEKLVFSALKAQRDVEICGTKLARATHEARLDNLTGLPNRTVFMESMNQMLARAERDGTLFALLFLDLDDFKRINDELGHGVGDQLLKCAATRLRKALPASACISRHGGDEFLVLLPEIATPREALEVARTLLDALAAEPAEGEVQLAITASVGISLYPRDGGNAETLVERADAAMYRAKRSGPGTPVQFATVPDAAFAPDAMHQVFVASTLAQEGARSPEDWHEQLTEANQQLLLAALDAQELQRAAEQAQRRQREHLAVVAHELRSPLSPIRLAAGMLGRIDAARLPEHLPKMREIIEREVVHMTRLIGDLLDLSRVHTGKLRLEKEVLALESVLADTVAASQPAVDARRQTLVLDIEAARVEVCGDPVRLAQIFRNLLDNASKYTPVGGKLSLSASRLENEVRIAISDTGIGISTAALDQVFEAFAQDGHAIGYNGSGLGIGLTVVRELVEGHGGRVNAYSDGPGLGSRFVVSLPVHRPHRG